MFKKLLLIVFLVVCFAAFTAPVMAQQGNQQTYVVQPGDTLARIGRIYNLDVNCLAQRNGITNPNRINRGQVIILDFTCPPYQDNYGTGGPVVGARNYVVQPGDGLNRIAQRFNLDLACLVRINRLANPNRIYPGQVLVLDFTCPPYAGFTVTPPAPPATGGPIVTPPPTGFTYVVQPGDSLGRIGFALGYDPYCIARTNGILNPNFIFTGQVLTISSACPRTR